MKFIKTNNGLYIRDDQLIGFQTLERFGKYEALAKLVTGELLVLNNFDTKAEAQEWLDEFVIQISKED